MNLTYTPRRSSLTVALSSKGIRVLAFLLGAVWPAPGRADDPTFLWAQTFGGSSGEESRGISATQVGRVEVGGFFLGTVDFDPGPSVDNRTSAGNHDCFVVTLETDGTYEGVITLGGPNFDWVNDVARDIEDNKSYAGRVNGTIDFDPTGGDDTQATGSLYFTFVTKIYADGTYAWTRLLGGGGAEPYAIAPDAAGNLFVAGYFTGSSIDFDPSAASDLFSSNGNEDVFITKLNSDGSYAWTRTFGSTAGDLANGVAVDGAGNVLITGEFRGTVDFDPQGTGDVRSSAGGSADVFVTKLGADGAYVWTYVAGSTGTDRGNEVTLATDGSVLVTGQFMGTVDFDPSEASDTHISNGGNWDAFLTRLLADGSYAWTRHFGGSQEDVGADVVADSSDNILVTGRFRGAVDFDPSGNVDSRNSNGNFDVFVATFNLDGSYGGVYTFGGSGNDRGEALDSDLAGYAFVTGSFEGTVDFDQGAGSDVHSATGSTDVFVVRVHYATVESPGACCKNGVCSFVTPTVCAAIDGSYQGDLIACVSVQCGGACCVGYECQLASPSQCDGLGGAFQGFDTVCTEDLCGGLGPAEGWSTAQHDQQRTGRSSGVVPGEQNRKWSVYVGGLDTGISPTIGPDGTVYVSSGRLVAVNPDGTVKWYDDPGGIAPPTVRADGHFFLPRHDHIAKINRADGSVFCSVSNDSRFTSALDTGGNCYFNGSTLIRKIGPQCGVQWSYAAPESVSSHVALGPDGGVYVSLEFSYVKLDPSDGSLVWAWPTSGRAGAAAIAADGTSYLIDAPNKLQAINPDGSEAWNAVLPGIGDPNAAPSPAIGADGTIYLVGTATPGPPLPTLVAVSATGTELWRVTEPVGYDPVSPVVDGNGTVLFTVQGSDVIALSPTDGAELWRLDVGGSDSVNQPPAIGDDGTVYVMTYLGYLIAFGEGCPEPPPLEPPYTFRRVAGVGDEISGYTIGQFEAFEIREDGSVSFQAYVPSVATSGVFTELPGGGVEAITRGTPLDGYVIDSVDLPRADVYGNTYMAAYVQDYGPAIFVNNQLYLGQANFSPPTATLLVQTIVEEDYVDHDNTGRFLFVGKLAVTDPNRLLSVDTQSGIITPLLAATDVIDGFICDRIQPDPIDGYGDDGVPVLQVDNGQFAIVTPDEVLARTGDEIDGRRVSFLGSPRRNAEGWVIFLGEHGGRSVFAWEASDPQGAFVRGVGDYVAGHLIAEIAAAAPNDARDLAFLAELIGTRGVFFNERPVAIANLTSINGSPVTSVAGNAFNGVSVNNVGQIAFVANDAWFVASLDWSFDIDNDGDVDSADYDSFGYCFPPGRGVPTCECLAWCDTNANLAVDCVDWTALKLSWTGPPLHPPFNPLCDQDCNGNSNADEFDIADEISTDCDGNSVPDDCQPDFDGDGFIDPCDNCELSNPDQADCQPNGLGDVCDIATTASQDCNQNLIPDECDMFVCSDGNVCTDDSCDGSQCMFRPNELACDDGNPCTIDDACSGSACAGTYRCRLYGDLVEPLCEFQPDVDDLLWVVCAFANANDCPGADIFPCAPDPCMGDADCAGSVTGAVCISGGCRCMGDGDCLAAGAVCNVSRQGGRCELVDVDDLTALVQAYGGNYFCGHPCPP